MVGPEIIFEHFPNLTEEQKVQFTQLGPLYADHNARVNVISRKDMPGYLKRRSPPNLKPTILKL